MDPPNSWDEPTSMGSAAWDDPTSLESSEVPGAAQDRIPNYRLRRPIGEGGMGEVWEGEQEKPVRRKVALKLIKVGMDSKQVVARFESERQALALMNHNNIARVLDAGVTERGRPFFAMEYVQGEPITDYCDRHRLGTRARLELFMRVCDGVQHAHQKGIIHRDIKPTNVMVCLEDDKPVPKIIDFGIAKATAQSLTDKTMVTQLGMLMGTPEYMSPEQAEMTGLDIDTRSDVYSLGMLLYELMVGTLPFDARTLRSVGFEEFLRRVREDEPRKPSTRLSTLGDASKDVARKHRSDPTALSRRLRGDLDWITMKALEKDRTRRYGSPADLAADVDRHLKDQPVLAGPPSATYRLRKFVRRHKAGAVVGSLLILTVLGGLAGTTYGLVRATRAEAKARSEATTAAQVSRFLVSLFEVSDPGRARGNSITARELLDRGAEKIRGELTDQPLILAQVIGTIGEVYLKLGLYPEARPLLEEALNSRRRALGDDHPELAGDMNGLGRLLYRLGDHEGARALFAEALAVREKTLPPDHPDIAESMTNLGAVANGMGDRERARSMFEQALEIRQEALPPEDPAVAQSLSNLAKVLSSLGHYEEARELHERSLAIQEEALGPDHISVGSSLDSLANVLFETGDHERARELFERALAILEKSLGSDAVRVAYAENNLARLLKKTGDYEGARAHYERSLAILELRLDAGHPMTTLVLYNLARVSALESDGDTALQFLRRSVEGGLAREIHARGYTPVAEEPDLVPLHGEPEFEALLRELATTGSGI